MTATTRVEHLAWCKERALEYLPGDPNQAMASFLSDLRKHPDTQAAGRTVGELMMMHAMAGLLTAENCRQLVIGTT